MRSSKSRSRSKTNRPRSLGNIINRVFDSSGPEGKVRGTPAQLIEKYQFLARDAQLSNDRVAAENFLQHAEHYTRLLAEANREMAAEQEQRQQYHQPNGGQNGNQNGQNGGQNNQNGNQNGGQNGQNSGQNSNQSGQNQPRDRQPGQNERRDDRGDYRPEYRSDFRDERQDEQPTISGHLLVDEGSDRDAGLVETPEAAARQPRHDEQRRNDRPNDRPRTDRPREEQRRPYPPRIDQQRVERQERVAEPVVAAPVSTMMPPMPAVEAAAQVEPVAATAPKPRSRSRAPKKPAEGGADLLTGTQDKVAD
ncbi:MAG: DUF4167 domain-containing protein [Paracoccaceae bacterium]